MANHSMSDSAWTNDKQEGDTFIEFTVNLKLKPSSLVMIERFRMEFGFKTRSATVSRILDELLCPEDHE